MGIICYITIPWRKIKALQFQQTYLLVVIQVGLCPSPRNLSL